MQEDERCSLRGGICHVGRFCAGWARRVALPFLESMLPAQTPLRAAELTPTRFTGIFIPHGAAPGYWIPETIGKDFAFPYIWEPLRTVPGPRGDHERTLVPVGRIAPRA